MAVCTRVGWPQLDVSCRARALMTMPEHAHVVGLETVHACPGARHATPDVAPADHHGHVDARLADVGDLVGDVVREGAVDAVPDLAGEDASPDSFSSTRR